MIVANLELAMHYKYNFIDLLITFLDDRGRWYLLGLKKPQEHGHKLFIFIIEPEDTQYLVYKRDRGGDVPLLPPIVLVRKYSLVQTKEIFEKVLRENLVLDLDWHLKKHVEVFVGLDRIVLVLSPSVLKVILNFFVQGFRQLLVAVESFQGPEK